MNHMEGCKTVENATIEIYLTSMTNGWLFPKAIRIMLLI